MRHKLTIPWTARLPVTRWWNRRHSPFATYTASSQGNTLHSNFAPPLGGRAPGGRPHESPGLRNIR
ncbi:hypothetical protein PDESU_06106 [Pontiella desulfatans]|uniref:Uncharacterized protein n=1 Tax=Pontiella desulfatans TaxID=2750659 RepID=A0A6C2UC31_PONDE|nr:hypothetical protein PDESU_06106 [Pontiella desulfatans]